MNEDDIAIGLSPFQPEKVSFKAGRIMLNKIERAVSKTKKYAYNNANWEIVDKAEADKNFVKSIDKKDLPKELQNKSIEELEKYVQQKSAERTQLQKEISELAIKRQEYIDAEIKKHGNSESDDLGKAIEK